MFFSFHFIGFHMKNKETVITYTLLGLILFVGFIARLVLFLKYPYVSGEDGGFYAFKTAELIKTGSLHEPFLRANPVIFYVSALFAFFSDVNTGVTIATALFSVLLGLSVFMLTQYLFNDTKAALIAAVLVVFSALSLRMMADVKKNVAGLFFIPLLFYFIFKSFDDKRYLIGVALTGILGILSHQSVIIVGFVLIGYMGLTLGMQQKIEKNEVVVLGILCIPALILTFILSDYVLQNIAIWIASHPGMFSKPFVELDWYLLPLLISAVPACVIWIRQGGRTDRFMLAWVLMAWLLTFPQIAGTQTWRYILLFFVPLAIACGYSISWLSQKAKSVAIISCIVLISIVVLQFVQFGLHDRQMHPKLEQRTMNALFESKTFLSDNAVVYSTEQQHTNYWIRYVYEREITQYSNQMRDTLREHLANGTSVYVVSFQNQQDPWIATSNSVSQEGVMFNQEGVVLTKISLESLEKEHVQNRPDAPQPSQTQQLSQSVYSTERLKYVSSYFLLPYELIMMTHLPAKELVLIIIGFTGSLFFFGLLFCVINLVMKKQCHDNSWCTTVLMIISVVFVLVVYIIQPPLFWGPTQQGMGIEPPLMQGNQASSESKFPPQTQAVQPNPLQNPGNKPKNEKTPCGDGYCDQAEQQNPTLCPKDCL